MEMKTVDQKFTSQKQQPEILTNLLSSLNIIVLFTRFPTYLDSTKNKPQ